MNMSVGTLRVHHIEPLSRANGPGLRTVIWFQGCTLGCPGCFNPQTHPFEGGEVWTVEGLLQAVMPYADQSEGLTLSGGEPLQQGEGLVDFLTQVRRRTPWSVILFTGYTWEEVQTLPWGHAVLNQLDVVIAGRYQAKRRLARGLLGSTNKTVHFLTSRYSMADLEQVPESEVMIDMNGRVRISGIDPMHWMRLHL
jgi:anaerobic ribonucleoside-triphosphate reductase activating protein